MPISSTNRRPMATAMVFVLATIASPHAHQHPALVQATAVDQVFSRWKGADTPGCAVGVGLAGRPLLQKPYGMADLEHGAPNLPDTIFEAGSVSKQFTAAAVLLLARDGKLSLDDSARRYLPELPDYGAPLTIRQMLTHTSGLRDWGTVASIGGWPRTTRVYTHEHVLDILSRQRSLNFPSGTDWSYSNSGYNLAAVLVSRVSGQSFAEFTRARIFEPLGMSRTSWRDDHGRIVEGRAIAYSEGGEGYRISMPFENVHGNGGLLTTVGDLLRWNENFARPIVGDAEFVRQQEEVGRLSGGREHSYALGLTVGRYRGVREVGHSGSTAGYRAHLVRFPDQQLSVAVLCNASTAAATDYARRVASLYLGDALTDPVKTEASRVAAVDLEARTGLYRSLETGEAVEFVRDGEYLRVRNGRRFVPVSERVLRADDGMTVTFSEDGRQASLTGGPTPTEYERVERATPTAGALEALVGTYRSDEADVALHVRVRDGKLLLERPPAERFPLEPLYENAFRTGFGTVIFHRPDGGPPAGLSLVLDRVWDMRFDRVEPPPRSTEARR